MKKVLVLFYVVFLLSAVGSTATKTWTVDNDRVECPDADFTVIKDAVNAASPGDIIKVYPGNYDHNENIVINKDGLTLIAADKDPINTRLFYNSIAIEASDVTLSGFHVAWPTVDTIMKYLILTAAGGPIRIGRSDHCGWDNNTISNCILGICDELGNYGGGVPIQIHNSSGNMILNNTIYGYFLSFDVPYIMIYSEGFPCLNNKVINNTIINGAIAFGSYWHGQGDYSGTKVHSNNVDLISIMKSSGRMMFSGNTANRPDTEIQFYIVDSSDYIIPGNANHGWPPGWVENGIIK